ncbi:GDP-mannose 4,6-dehydratase [Enterococcus dispar]|uniref:GDP-mannose 4,6-dehydratase n=1 Tax=Enterococcus dispar TaxID=44009 RepID=UPI0035DBC127
MSDRDLVTQIFSKYKFDAVINFAAESHVNRLIVNASNFYHTNIGVVLNLLDIARKSSISNFIQILFVMK